MGLCQEDALLSLHCSVAACFGAVLPGFGVSVLHRPAGAAAASLLQVPGTSDILPALEEPAELGRTRFFGPILFLRPS